MAGDTEPLGKVKLNMDYLSNMWTIQVLRKYNYSVLYYYSLINLPNKTPTRLWTLNNNKEARKNFHSINL